MDRPVPYLPFDDENDRIPYDDELSEEFAGMSCRFPLDEDEAYAYSSVYDMPHPSRTERKEPKQ